MFVKFSKCYCNLDNVIFVQEGPDGTGTLVETGAEFKECLLTAEDMELFRAAIGPPVPTPERKVTDRVSELIHAVADSYYQAYVRDQTVDFDSETDEPGEDEWPHWQAVRKLVQDISGINLLETSRECAFEKLATWKSANCPVPIQPLTAKEFRLPYKIVVRRVPGNDPEAKAASIYTATISSSIDKEIGGIGRTAADRMAAYLSVALESLIVAHARQGIDIGAKEYVMGVVDAVEKLAEEY